MSVEPMASSSAQKVNFAVDNSQKESSSFQTVNVILVEEENLTEDFSTAAISPDMRISSRDSDSGVRDDKEAGDLIPTFQSSNTIVDTVLKVDSPAPLNNDLRKRKADPGSSGVAAKKSCKDGCSKHVDNEEKENRSNNSPGKLEGVITFGEEDSNSVEVIKNLPLQEGKKIRNTDSASPSMTPKREKKERKTARETKREKRAKIPGEKGPVQCEFCEKILASKYGLREHLAVVHFKNGKFECEICGKRVTNNRALKLHMTSHSSERQHVCELCGSSHKTKGNLNYHMKTMHTMIKNFRCDLCFKTFKVQAELKEHCFQFHSAEGVITCIVCKKKLTTALSIYTHSVMHSGAREYECDICGYAFKTFTGLKEHKVVHSDSKPIRQCPHCDKKFFSRSQYNAHLMRHTAEGALITYQCPVPSCGVKFQHKSSYNRHVIRHQPGGDLEHPKENPYQYLDESQLPEGVCPKCRKFYNSKSGFYLHLKKCRDGIVQKFPCPLCDRSCSNRSSLKRHMQRRHKGVDFDGREVNAHEIKGEIDLEAARQASAITTQDIQGQDELQYQTNFFSTYNSGQLTTVDGTHLTTVDVQLLLEAAGDHGEDQTTQLLTTAQLQPGQEGTRLPLQILTENEAAQIIANAAQLQQQGVIVSDTDVNDETNLLQDGQATQIIVSSRQLDGPAGQLVVSTGHTAQLLGNNQTVDDGELEDEEGLGQHIHQGTHHNNLLGNQEQGRILQYNQPTVIRIHHSQAQVTSLGTQQLITLQGKEVNSELDASNIHVNELSTDSIGGQGIDMEEIGNEEGYVVQLDPETVSQLREQTSDVTDTDGHLSVTHSTESLQEQLHHVQHGVTV